MSLRVRPGQVHGLDRPNGAGKTTFVDAVTEFVTPHAGSIRLDGVELRPWSPRRRARAGLARSFQSGELFGDLTVRENLAVSCDDGSWTRYALDLVAPRRIALAAPRKRLSTSLSSSRCSTNCRARSPSDSVAR